MVWFRYKLAIVTYKCALAAQQASCALGCIPSSVGTGWGRGSCPSAPLCWDPPGSLASSSGALSTGQSWSCWSGARWGHKSDQRDGTTPLLGGQARRAGAVPLGEEKAQGRPYCGLPVLKGTCKKDGDKLFSRACCDRTRDNGFKLRESRFRLAIRKKVFTMRVWNPGPGCPERWSMPHPWKHSRPGWTGLWATWSCWRCPCSLQGVWTRWSLKVLSNPNYSMFV